MLTWNAEEYRSWEDFALGNAATETGIPRATVSTLLQIHWAWIAPMFMWVYRPAFMRKAPPWLYLICRISSDTLQGT
jgi:hypothetical protein